MKLYVKKLKFHIKIGLKIKQSPGIPYLSEIFQNTGFKDIVLHLW